MIELNKNDLKAMITSPDEESRRLGFTLVFENINDIPPAELVSFKEAYSNIINMHTMITGGLGSLWNDEEYNKTHYLTWGSVMEDITFIKENVCNDIPTLKSVFPELVIPYNTIKIKA